MAKAAKDQNRLEQRVQDRRKGAAERARERVPESFRPEADRLWNRMRSKGLKWTSLLGQFKLLRHYAEGLQEQGVSRFEDATVENIETYLAELEDAPYTIQQRVKLVKRLHAFLAGMKRGEYPEVVEWLSPKDYQGNGDNDFDPDKLDFYRNHARTTFDLVHACDNSRDRAIIMVLADSGARRSELGVMLVSDWVPKNEKLAHVKLRGKTGERTVPVSRSISWMNRWLNDHPDPRPDAPLWTADRTDREGRVEALNPGSMYRIVTNASEKAGHDPVLGPHDLRHGHATECAQLGMNEGVMRARFGWKKGSQMPSRYAHAVAADSEKHALKLGGYEIEETEEGPVMVLTPQTCPQCGTDKQPADARFCFRCGQPLNAEAREALRDMRRMLLEDPELMQALATEAARLLKQGYTRTGEDDVDGVPGIEEL